MRDCLVARRIVLICGSEQCQARALCKDCLSFFACRLDVCFMASLPSVLCAMDARKCVCACDDLSQAAEGFERIVSRI